MTIAAASRPPRDTSPRAANITGLVLAGGRSPRVQGTGDDIDKGLVLLDGRPLAGHAIDRLAPQVERLLISANRHLDDYRRFGHPVIADRIEGFAGPLAGVHAGLGAAQTDWVITVPCDSPYFPLDLASTLLAAAQAQRVDAAFVRVGSRRHPAFLLARRSLLAHLESALAAGERRVERWLQSIDAAEVAFSDEAAFTNVNTHADLAAIERDPPWSRIADLTVPGAVEAGRPLPVSAARAIIEQFVRRRLAVESLPLGDCLGRILAADLSSPIDVPPHDNSAMDGFAVRFADIDPAAPTWLAVIGSARAGAPFTGCCGPGQAVRVMTGAVIPPGADLVVPQEAVTPAQTAPVGDVRHAPKVSIPPGQQAGQHLRRRGEDLSRGAIALEAGRRLTPADLGLAASLGLGELAVRRRIRVAVFSTGDELLAIGAAPVPGKVYDSNRYTLCGMLSRLGAIPIDRGIVPDRPEALAGALREAAAVADVVISSGGVAAGEADFTRAALAGIGDVAFWTLAMRPGRPLAFGRIADAVYFGLPGNPVAVMVAFHFLVRIALARLAAETIPAIPLIRARCASAISKQPGRTEYQRGCLTRLADGSAEARLTGSQGSGVLRSMSEADCILVLDADRGDIAAGDWVDVVPFNGLV